MKIISSLLKNFIYKINKLKNNIKLKDISLRLEENYIEIIDNRKLSILKTYHEHIPLYLNLYCGLKQFIIYWDSIIKDSKVNFETLNENSSNKTIYKGIKNNYIKEII